MCVEIFFTDFIISMQIKYLCHVKNWLKIIALLQLTVLYGYLAGTNHIKLGMYSYETGMTDSNHELSFSFVSSNLLCHTINEGSISNATGNSPSTRIREKHNCFSMIVKKAIVSNAHKLLKHIAYVSQIDIQCSAADLIFPFHYFL